MSAKEDAKAIRNAIKGLGTDDEKLVEILTKRSNEQLIAVANEYTASFGISIYDDIKGDTSGNYKELLVGLVQAKPTYLARVVHNAVKGAGTDEAALIDAIVHQPNAVIKATGEAYQKLFNKSMSGDISGDTSGDFKKLFVGLCSAHRDESNNFDPAKAQADAELLYKKGEGKIGTDEETFIEFFLTRSFAHIREVNKLYNQKRGHDLAVAIDSEFSGNIRRGLKALALSREDYWASRIRKAIKGLGTNDAVLVRAFVINSREQLKQIEQAYNTYEERKKGKGKKDKKDKKDKKGKKASNSLVNDIKGDTSGWYEKSLLGLLQ